MLPDAIVTDADLHPVDGAEANATIEETPENLERFLEDSTGSRPAS
jgi:hypothetical protein